MTTMPQPLALGSGFTATYDAWNRMVIVANSGGTVLTNEYDGNNHRIRKVVNGGDTFDYYYNDKWQIIVEAKNGTADSMFAWHLYYIDALAVRFRASDKYLFLHDANFNVTAAYDVLSTSGTYRTVTERYRYTPYGEVKILDSNFADDANQISDIGNYHLYTGRERDPETGLQLNRERWYHALLGRWISRDPAEYNGRLLRQVRLRLIKLDQVLGVLESRPLTYNVFGLEPNLYGYAENRPLIRLDPTGKWAGVDDIFTGPVDEIIVLYGAWAAFSAWWFRDDIADACNACAADIQRELEQLYRELEFLQAKWDSIMQDSQHQTGTPGLGIGEGYKLDKTEQDIARVLADIARLESECQSRAGAGETSRPNDGVGWDDCACCFVEGTLILMADGSSKPIEEVEFGEQVLSYDFDRKVTIPKTVCLRDNPVRKKIIDLKLAGVKVVSSTTDHPYWVQGKGWCSFDPKMTLSRYDIFRNNGIMVQQLQIGDTLLFAKSPRDQDGPIVVSEIALESIIERDLKPTSLWVLRVGDYGKDWRVTKELFEGARASGDFTIYHKEMKLMQSREASPHSHNFFANGVLVHNK